MEDGVAALESDTDSPRGLEVTRDSSSVVPCSWRSRFRFLRRALFFWLSSVKTGKNHYTPLLLTTQALYLQHVKNSCPKPFGILQFYIFVTAFFITSTAIHIIEYEKARKANNQKTPIQNKY